MAISFKEALAKAGRARVLPDEPNPAADGDRLVEKGEGLEIDGAGHEPNSEELAKADPNKPKMVDIADLLVDMIDEGKFDLPDEHDGEAKDTKA